MMDTDYTPAPSLSDAHAQWHAIHGRNTACPLDCGVGEAEAAWEAMALDYEAPVAVRCGHCGGRHTVAGVRECSIR